MKCASSELNIGRRPISGGKAAAYSVKELALSITQTRNYLLIHEFSQQCHLPQVVNHNCV